MGKSTPDAPDYKAAAEATGEASRQVTEAQTWANRPNQTTPWGSTEWSNTPVYDPTTGQDINRWSSQETLTPESQRALDSQLALTADRSDLAGGMMNRVGSELGEQMDWSKYGPQVGGADFTEVGAGGLDPRVTGVATGQYDTPDLQRSLDYAGAPEIGDPTATRDRAENAIYDRRASRLDPQFENRSTALDVKLRNQGLRPGDEAYDREMGNFTRERTDAYETAQNEAIMGGGAEASRMFGLEAERRGVYTGEAGEQAGFFNQAAGQQSGLDLATGGQRFSEAMGAGTFANQAREADLGEQLRIADRDFSGQNVEADRANELRMNQINEELASRGTSLNEINALISGQQVSPAQMGPVNLASRAAGVDYSGAAQDQYAAALDQFNAKQAGTQGLMSGATSVAGFFSDRRLKQFIRRIGEFKGYPLYFFQYIWGEWAVGIMADEINQDAVFKHSSGYDMVDYGRIA